MPEASRSDDLDAMRQLAHSPGDSSSLRELRAEGKKTARERISQLLDKGSFVEVDSSSTGLGITTCTFIAPWGMESWLAMG